MYDQEVLLSDHVSCHSIYAHGGLTVQVANKQPNLLIVYGGTAIRETQPIKSSLTISDEMV